MAWFFRPPRRIVYKGRRDQTSEEILDRLRSYLDDRDADLVEILCGFWEDQQDAITYQELRQLVMQGYLDEVTSRLWQQDYSYLVTERLPQIWGDAMIAGAASQPIMDEVISSFTFNTQTPGALQWIRSRGAALVTSCTQTQKDAISLLLEDSIRNTHSVDELARLIRPCVGLTRGQTSAAKNYYENMVKTLTEQHPRTKPERIQARALEKTAKYAERLHRQRAMTIAQTEMAYAYNFGADEGIRQAQADFLIGKCVKRWITSRDDNVCPNCADLDGTQVGMEDTFFSGNKVEYDESGLFPPLHPRCACALQYIEVEPPNPPWRGRDVRAEYTTYSNPGAGKVSFENGYDKAKYPEEVKTAEWLHDNIGGNIRLLNESGVDGVKRADYLWDGKLWDLKSTTTVKAADAAVRKGMKQIAENPGGIILNYGSNHVPVEEVRSVVSDRVKFSGHGKMDVLILMDEQVAGAFRYSK